MKVLFCSSEVYPFSKSGGLADVAYFLPKELNNRGHDVKIITPYYKAIAKHHSEMQFLGRKTFYMGEVQVIVNYFTMVYQNITYIFVQDMRYFERDFMYGYEDDAERFSCFNYAILEVMDLLDSFPDIIHLNDWQTGMVPYLLDEHYRFKNEKYRSIQTLLTIHNLEYQGSFDPSVSRFFNTDFNYTYIHFDRVNFLKAGISRASKINTVSPSYREEVLDSKYGFSLDGALYQRKSDFTGILNGIDLSVFNPKNDMLIDYQYTVQNVVSQKRMNKKAILSKFHLNNDVKQPLVVYIGRLATQKGIDLIMQTLEEVIFYSSASYILMGSGDSKVQDFFEYLTRQYPSRVSCYIGFNEEIAHKLYAASDLFMMPSAFEPCGLGQMIAMTYGSLPIVRERGGLKDTVIPYNKYTDQGTGFSFSNYSAVEFKDKLFEAIQLYDEQPQIFKKLVRQAMKQDFSLEKMAEQYEMLYKKMLGV